MNSNDSFIEDVKNVCSRRGMYVCGESFYEVCAYFTGYAHASRDCPLSGEGWKAFNDFICATFRFPSKYSWPYVLMQCSRDDDEATARLQSLLTEFAERTKTERPEEIVQDVMSRASSHEEGEPEKTWRRFSRALHRGSREEIEPLIQEHPEAKILWSATSPDRVGSRPSDRVASLLQQIDDSYLLSQVSGSEAEGEVTIITPDFGPVEVKLIGGSWRIDATKVIDCRKAIRTVRPDNSMLQTASRRGRSPCSATDESG